MLDAAAIGPALIGLRPRGGPVSDLMARGVRLVHFDPLAATRPLFAAPGGPVGSRFVPPHSPIRALYLSRDAGTAYREGNQTFFQALAAPGGLALAQAGYLRATELVILGIHVRAAAILDLRDPGVQAALGTTPAELRSNWRGQAGAPTQLLGEAIFQDGTYEGLLFDSVRDPGHDCLLVFPDRLRAGSRIDFRSLTPGLPNQTHP